jgi:GTP-dependent phosphoenolpyruvate carboxykinase
LKELLSIDRDSWASEIENQTEFFAKFDRLPDEIRSQQEGLKKRLGL